MDKAEKLKILVKLPVKLGDTVMASSFLTELKTRFPASRVDVIMEAGLTDLKYFIPVIDHMYPFSKKKYSGLSGNYRFGRWISGYEKYDLFFCLPSSFSSALAGFFTGSRVRVGYKTEGRAFLFSKSYKKTPHIHVLEEYVELLEKFTGEKIGYKAPEFRFREPIDYPLPGDYVVLNACSGPPSRYIPVAKAVRIIKNIKQNFPFDIVLTGAPAEEAYLAEIVRDAGKDARVINLAGKTSIIELGWVLKNARAMVTTDSGNAHFANAFGTRAVVLFGAGLPWRARPYNGKLIRSLALEDLDCVPCRSEQCKYHDNRCLANIDDALIIRSMKELLNMND